MNALAYRRRDAAGILTVSERSIDRKIARGELPVIRIGRRVLIPRAAIEALVAGAQVEIRGHKRQPAVETAPADALTGQTTP
jgi:excisionase family DNA binding protein